MDSFACNFKLYPLEKDLLQISQILCLFTLALLAELSFDADDIFPEFKFSPQMYDLVSSFSSLIAISI